MYRRCGGWKPRNTWTISSRCLTYMYTHMCVCVRVFGNECVCVCLCVREFKSVRLCIHVCVRERERERVSSSE